MRKALIRCDAGTDIGFGHAVRCSALGRRLRRAGWEVAVAISEEGYRRVPDLGEFAFLPVAETLSTPADLVILDLLTPDLELEQKLARAGRYLLILDDAPEHAHIGHWLVDATPGRKAADYASLAPGLKIFTGPAYAPIREAIRTARATAEPWQAVPDPTHILVAFGGSDPTNRTCLALDALSRTGFAGKVTVILGREAPHIAAVEAACAALPQASLVVATPDIAAYYLAADLIIGGAGTAAWERCCLGRPALIVPVVDSQIEWADRLQDLGAAAICPPDAALLADGLATLLATPERRAAMAQASARLVDGRGADRLLLALAPAVPVLDGHLTLRLLETDDIPLVNAWQLDPETLPFARLNDGTIPETGWLPPDVSAPDRLLLIAMAARSDTDTPVAFIRLDRQDAPLSGWEVMIATAPNHARRGVGRAALRLLASLMPTETLIAHVPPGDQASHGFFQALGYIPISEEWYRSNHSPL